MIWFLVGYAIGSFLDLLTQKIRCKRHSIRSTKQRRQKSTSITGRLWLKQSDNYVCFGNYWQGMAVISGGIFSLCLGDFWNIEQWYYLSIIMMALALSLTDLYYQIVEPYFFYPFSFIVLIGHLWLRFPFYWQTGGIVCCLFIGFQQLMKRSLGGGDVLLLVFWSMLFGSHSLLWIILIASFSASLFWLGCDWLGYPVQELPFVPFLSFGLFLVIFQQFFYFKIG